VHAGAPDVPPGFTGQGIVDGGDQDLFTKRDFLESTQLPGKGPYYGGSFEFGNNKPHCSVGEIPDGVPMMTHFVRLFADYIRGAAPKGTDATSWN